MGMPMYALGVLPLIHKLDTHAVHQIWYADDACATGSLRDLRRWWDDLLLLGPDYGYFINASNCWLLLKDPAVADVALFDGTGVNVCSGGRRYLGSAIGTSDFVNDFVLAQVQAWYDELSVHCMPDLNLILFFHRICMSMVLLVNGLFFVEPLQTFPIFSIH